jgi:hypothetical protein
VADEALAHPAHGAPEIHLHWWSTRCSPRIAALIAWVGRR